MRASMTWLAVGAAVTLAGCTGQTETRTETRTSPAASAPPPAAAPTSAPTARDYGIRGKVTEIAADRRSVTLDHEEIPGLMAAMKMAYPVSDPALLKGLAVGDRVEGRLQASGSNYTVVSLTKR